MRTRRLPHRCPRSPAPPEMTVFITGATGFLGRRTLGELLRAGHRVRCLARSPASAARLDSAVPRERRGQVDLFVGSLADATEHPHWLAGCDAVVHMAAKLSGSAPALFAVNVLGTRAVVEAAAREGVGRFVLLSSIGIYAARPRGELLDERCAVEPSPHLRDPYTFSKIAQEQIVWAEHGSGRLPAVVLRPGVIFGPGRPLISGRIGLRVGPLFIQIGGRRAAPYVFVDNCAAAVACAVTADGIDGRAFNLVDDRLPTTKQLFAMSNRIRRMPSVTVPQWTIGPLAAMYDRYATRSNGQFPSVLTRYRAAAQWTPLRYSNALAKSALGWRPSVPLNEALSLTTAALERERGV
jgi:nucleoside-diphosphate-sugar epimerase